jgi:hypothetical protein
MIEIKFTPMDSSHYSLLKVVTITYIIKDLKNFYRLEKIIKQGFSQVSGHPGIGVHCRQLCLADSLPCLQALPPYLFHFHYPRTHYQQLCVAAEQVILPYSCAYPFSFSAT